MPLVELNWSPSDRQLRQFAVACMIALPALGWLWGLSSPSVLVLGISGLVLVGAGMAFPKFLKPVFVFLMLVTSPIGIVVGELALLLIYFGVFLPFSLAFRIIGRDALQLKRPRSAESHWQPRKQPAEIRSYYRQS